MTAKKTTMNLWARLVAVLAIALLVPILHAPTADAAQFQTPTGRPGAVNLNGPMITGYDFQTRLANGTYFYSKSWEASGFTVGRSPGYAGAQDVVGIYALQRHINGRWTTWESRTYNGRVSGAGTLRFPQWAHYPTNQPNSRYGYRMIYVVGWFVAGTNQSVGSATVVPSTTNDNRCHTRFGLRCEAYWDGIVF